MAKIVAGQPEREPTSHCILPETAMATSTPKSGLDLKKAT
jgi:hypothetical protein